MTSFRWERASRGVSVTVRLAVLCAAASACRPELSQTVSIVSGTQILAVQSDPAEARPGATVSYRALVVHAGGALSPSARWAFCSAREPLAELGPVSPKCYAGAGEWFTPFGVGNQATGSLPVATCRSFGPEVPPAMGNQPPGRPVDPDATGGYYQPITLHVASASGDVIGVAATRLTCGLAGTPDQVATFTAHDTPNDNPEVASLSAGSAAWSSDEQGATNAVQGGTLLPLQVTWSACPQSTGACGDHYCDLGETKDSCPEDCATLSACAGAETYVALDLVAHALVTRREGMQVAWFATAGTFDDDRTGRDPSDPAHETANRWRAPATAGHVHVWVVLRDDRGGVGWKGYLVDVR